VAAKDHKVDNATIIRALHSGTWPTLLGDLSWSANGAPKGEFNLVQWQQGKLLPVYPASIAQGTPEAAKPNWGG
jgi:branched-chain amino acid transport system substrate-binding protein